MLGSWRQNRVLIPETNQGLDLGDEPELGLTDETVFGSRKQAKARIPETNLDLYPRDEQRFRF